MTELTTSTSEAPDLQTLTSRQEVWWKTGPIYHLYPRSFRDSNGDGIGDLRGIIERLDYLNDGTDRSLQASGVWLSPIYLSPGRDGGYDVADHTTIDPTFGTMADFETLMAECNQRGMHIVMDMVLNHTSDLHPWFLESRASPTSARRDWYIWRKPTRGRRPPNNWRSYFGGSAWAFDDETGEYYLHTFLPEQPDLNWQNPEVQAACLEVVRFWLDRGVSGFRLDVFNAYFKHPDLPDNPRRLGSSAWRRQRHMYNKDRPELHGFLLQLRALLNEYAETMAVGETFDAPPEIAASYCDKLHMAFDFDLLQQPWKPAAIQRAIARWDRLFDAENSWPCYVLSNHDNPRHAWRYGHGMARSEADARAKVAAALLLTLRGTPFIYYGEEIGMQGEAIQVIDTWDEAPEARDSSRTPMQWDTAANAGFSEGRPWLPVASDFPSRNVAAQDSDPRSILNFYRRVVALRNQTPALTRGIWQPLIEEPRTAMVYLRRYQSEHALVALNFTSARVRVELDRQLPLRYWQTRISTRRPDVGWTVRLDRSLALAPYEASVFTAHQEPSPSAG